MTGRIQFGVRPALLCSATLVGLAGGCARIGDVADGLRSSFGGAEAAAVPQPEAEPAALADVSGCVAWDGRASLGGVWVAHAHVSDPLRVRIARVSNGASVDGWLFRRDPPEAGPELQISSEAASELGIDANAPTMLSVERLDATG